MILLIDNYDSFVYTLGRYVGMLGHAREVVRNDAITLNDIAANPPEAIIISPGPCTPKEAGISTALIKTFAGRIPILGVCLGHQCIAEAFGGRTIRAPYPCHGRTSSIVHNAEAMFMGLPNPMIAARYHSLIVELTAASPLEITATTEADDIIMGIRHKTLPVFGLQFHPESVMTEYGLDLIRNFTMIAAQWNARDGSGRRAA